MNNVDWDIDEIDIKRNEFKLEQIKLEHFYFNFDDKEAGMPISTSVELKRDYNIELKKLEWKKIIVHKYFSLTDGMSVSSNTYEEKCDDSEELIKKLEKYDLRELKNNYYTDEDLKSFTHWEITYNNYFKIVGTYDAVILEFEKLSEILDLKNIMQKEKNNIKNMMEDR